MPKLNPFERALLPINRDYKRLTQKANKAKGPRFGDVEQSKREARARLRQEWATMTPEQKAAELTVPGRAGEILDLLGTEG